MDSIGLIREFLEERLAVTPESVLPAASLAELGVDSLLMLELIFEFEDRFDIKLSSGLEAPKTVGEMVTLMDSLIAEKKS